MEQSPGPVDAGDVDEDVEVAHLGGDLRGEIVDGGPVGDIGVMGVDPLLVVFQFVDGGFESVGFGSGHHDDGPFVQQLAGRLQPDARTRSCHQCRAAADVEIHVSPSAVSDVCRIRGCG